MFVNTSIDIFNVDKHIQFCYFYRIVQLGNTSE